MSGLPESGQDWAIYNYTPYESSGGCGVASQTLTWAALPRRRGNGGCGGEQGPHLLRLPPLALRAAISAGCIGMRDPKRPRAAAERAAQFTIQTPVVLKIASTLIGAVQPADFNSSVCIWRNRSIAAGMICCRSLRCLAVRLAVIRAVASLCCRR
jgi:hypothetical protein